MTRIGRIALAFVCAVETCVVLARPVAAASKESSPDYRVAVAGHVTAESGVLDGTLTFDHEVQVPGAALPAGTYRFTLVPPTAMRVTNEDGTKVYAMFDTTPIDRELTTSHAHVSAANTKARTNRVITAPSFRDALARITLAIASKRVPVGRVRRESERRKRRRRSHRDWPTR